MNTDTQTARYTADVQRDVPGQLAGEWHRTRDGRVAACGARLLDDPDLYTRLPRSARPCARCGC